MHTYPSCLGQEAIGTGIGLAMHDDDILVPYYRDQATQVIRGVKMQQILQVWDGDESGYLFEGVAAKDFPNSVPIGTQMSHAAVAADLATAPQAADDFMALVFASMTPPLVAQREQLLARLERDNAAEGVKTHDR